MLLLTASQYRWFAVDVPVFRLLLPSLAWLVATACRLVLTYVCILIQDLGHKSPTFSHATDVREVSAGCQRSLVADLGGRRREAWHVLGLGYREGRETGDKNRSSLENSTVHRRLHPFPMAAAFWHPLLWNTVSGCYTQGDFMIFARRAC